MGILMAFAPFIVIALLDRLAGPKERLVAGALVAVGLAVRDWVAPGRSPKILEIGSFGAGGGNTRIGGVFGAAILMGGRSCIGLPRHTQQTFSRHSQYLQTW